MDSRMCFVFLCFFFFFKQKTAYDMRISDWSSDVCSSDLRRQGLAEQIALKLVAALLMQCLHLLAGFHTFGDNRHVQRMAQADDDLGQLAGGVVGQHGLHEAAVVLQMFYREAGQVMQVGKAGAKVVHGEADAALRSEAHTTELQSLMRISYAVFCLTKK